jgi:hypothetical protein
MTTTENRIIAQKDGSFTVNVEGGTITTGFKELTDEEIWELWELMNRSEDAWVPEEQVQGFARAILRKAQNG